MCDPPSVWLGAQGTIIAAFRVQYFRLQHRTCKPLVTTSADPQMQTVFFNAPLALENRPRLTRFTPTAQRIARVAQRITRVAQRIARALTLASALACGASAFAQQCAVTPPLDPSSPTVVPINTQNRQAVIQAYQQIFVPTQSTPLNWTGSVAGCVAGDTSATYKTAVTRMVNYHRAMAGLPGNLTMNATYSAKAQQAALMMHANNDLNHTPPTTWNCYTAAGAEAADKSNLALGAAAIGTFFNGIKLYMDDENVPELGHRRWILYPPQAEIGTGDTSNANALWVLGPFGARPSTPNGVAWPPAGFVPYPLVSASARWSFSIANTNFAGATVEVRNGQNQIVPINTTIDPMGFGDPSISFLPTAGSWAYATSGDTVYDVTVSNVNVGGSMRNFSYRVTLITP
jgi:uncharacterized protein YkwD